MAADLVISDSLPVHTKHGKCEIELCLGSVTEVKTLVDVLVISSFPGDYTPTPSSVIGALLKDLQISVRTLAKNKEEDLRKFSSCWWSKPLRKGLPYKRILCFEGGFKKGVRPPSTVGEVFRSLNSLCRNEDISVIMPLLATGDQAYKKTLMLRLIVEATIHWMEIGLPLKLLKLVIFTRNPHNPDKSVLHITQAFQELKSKWHNKAKNFQQDLSFKYDVYLSYSASDQNIADMVLKSLEKQNMRVFHERQNVDEEESFQEKIYQVMITCAKIVAILSPRYLADISCIEQYNIGLCCTRNMNRDFLAPLFIEEILGMPTYMGLIQYMDCRPATAEMISKACQSISSAVKSIENNKNKDTEMADQRNKVYDLFISYSHKDTNKANAILGCIKDERPNWKIFIDQSGLNAGVAWQSKLYQSIEESITVVALLSYNYMESKVCQEEYNLARSLHEDPNYFTRLVVIELETIDTWPVWCAPNFALDFTDDKENKSRSKQLINIIEIQNRSEDSLRLTEAVLSIKHISSIWRTRFAEQNFPVVKGENFLDESEFSSFAHKSESKYDIVLSYHKSEQPEANVLIEKLKEVIPSLKIAASSISEKSSRLHVIDEAALIVPLLSDAYVKSVGLMEEFNTALCRHRFSDELLLFPIIVNELPMSPVYPQIALCLFSCEDEYWVRKKPFDPVHSCMKSASIVISNVLVKKPKNPMSFKTLLNLRELEEWSYHKTRHGDNEEYHISPICFTANRSGHEAAGCAERDQSVTTHGIDADTSEPSAVRMLEVSKVETHDSRSADSLSNHNDLTDKDQTRAKENDANEETLRTNCNQGDGLKKVKSSSSIACVIT